MAIKKSIQLTKNNQVTIIGAAPNINLESELYAINWFDLKRPKLYDFYNQLAYPHVKAANGRVHFKGIVTQKIKGPKENDREMLLIVRYPDADSFLSMISNRMFLLKSALRMKSVDYFTFGFTKRMDQGAQPLSEPVDYNGKGKYLLFHFQNKASSAKIIYELEEALSGFKVKSHFLGYKAALVGRSTDGSKLRTQPFLMDGLCVFEAANEASLTKFMESKALQSIIHDNLSNSFYFIERLI